MILLLTATATCVTLRGLARGKGYHIDPPLRTDLKLLKEGVDRCFACCYNLCSNLSRRNKQVEHRKFRELTDEEATNLILASRRGKEIQVFSKSSGWRDCISPMWQKNMMYRIKPDPKPFGELTEDQAVLLFREWFRGKTIQVCSCVSEGWLDTKYPAWSKLLTYRVKPENEEY